MRVKRNSLRKKNAFTLLELSVSIGIIALMLSGVLVVVADFTNKQAAVDTQTDLNVIYDALIRYKERNGKLPCPASQTTLYGAADYGKQVNSGDCTYTSAPAGSTRTETAASSGVWVLSGAVPVRDLLLRDSYMKDQFGNRITYVVPQVLTSASTFAAGAGAITIKNTAGNDITTTGGLALISHGKDGKGAYREGSGALKEACGASANLDVENCDADTTITDAAFSDGQVTANFFDDSVLWKDKIDLVDPEAPASSSCSATTEAGFRLDGAASNLSGTSIAAGDVNGDGYGDVIVGTGFSANKAYLVFGTESGVTASPTTLASLNGTNGFVMTGYDETGKSVRSGDVNGDGFDDLIIGAPQDLTTGVAPAVYVVFGKASGWAASLDLSTLNGTTGFIIQTNGYYGGWQVGSGDINNDGFADIIFTQQGASTGPPWNQEGYIAVVFGKASGWAATMHFTDLNGTNGFVLWGDIGYSYLGVSFATGDINNDGFDDIIAGAHFQSAGYTYVIFGKSGAWSASASLSTLNGTNGFRLDGVTAGEESGSPVSSGDVNGDGFDDILIGAPGADNGGTNRGSAYVVFGKSGAWTTPTALSSLNGTTGFRLDGVANSDAAGAVASGGDFNGDGFDDILVGAYGADNNSKASSGSAYLVFGKASGWAATLGLSTLNGTTGFRMDGSAATHLAGGSVAFDKTCGTLSGILVGATQAGYGGANSGSTYGFQGRTTPMSATYDLNILAGIAGPLGNTITGITYTVDTTTGCCTGQNNEAKMRDGDYTTGNSVIATNNGTPSIVKADFGSTKNVRAIKLAPYTSWGEAYLNNMAVECSTDNSSWSNIVTTSGHSNGVTKTYDVNVNCRYIRIQANNWIGTGDFWFEN